MNVSKYIDVPKTLIDKLVLVFHFAGILKISKLKFGESFPEESFPKESFPEYLYLRRNKETFEQLFQLGEKINNSEMDSVILDVLKKDNIYWLKTLIDAGVDFNNARPSLGDLTPLGMAISGRKMKTFEFLLGLKGIDVNMKSKGDYTPLHLA